MKKIQPQEIEVFYIMPAIRRELTLAMKELGYTQKKIAALLSVTEPAVSQYLSKKRANVLKFSDEMKTEVMESAKKIEDHYSLIEQMQHLMQLANNEKMKCSPCNEFAGTEEGCDICYKRSNENGS